jgi:glyoxylase-like metal-dependent hydrolase (beta-lactamase superfamily II)
MGDHTPADSVEIKVKDGELIKLDQLELRAIYTPGHTSDSFSFLMNNYLFSGDTLLINGTGRTDFQNGNAKDAYDSIFNKLLKLPDETLLYPAHDYKGENVSTIGKEKKLNPRLQVENVNQYIEIMNDLNLQKPVSLDFNISCNLKLGAI